jgi:type I restriction enzyme M protein
MTSAEDIEKGAWRAIEALRGQLPLRHCGHYALCLIFLKFCSDLRRDTLPEALSTSMPAWGRLRIPPTCNFDLLFGRKQNDPIGSIVDETLKHLEHENREILGGVFAGLSFGKDPARGSHDSGSLCLAVEGLATLDLRPSALAWESAVADAFESLVGSLGEQSERIYVPPAVSSIISRILAPKPGESIYDPICGAGMILAKLAREAGSGQSSITGHESDPSALSLCKMNLILHGIEASHIEQRNPLADPLVSANGRLTQFDVVVGNPPFGLRWDSRAAETDDLGRFWRGVPPSGRSEYAFVSHMVESMREARGRAGVLVPLGALFRGGAEAAIRQRLVEDNILKAVVELPPNLFYGTAIQVALLLLDKSASPEQVLIVDAGREFVSKGGQNRLSAEHIEKIVATLAADSDIAGFSRHVGHEEIRAGGYILSASRYIEMRSDTAFADISEIEAEIETIETELKVIQSDIQTCLESRARLSDGLSSSSDKQRI